MRPRFHSEWTAGIRRRSMIFGFALAMIVVASRDSAAVASSLVTVADKTTVTRPIFQTDATIKTYSSIGGKVSSVANVLAATSSFVGAVCSATKSFTCAGVAFLVSGATWTTSALANHMVVEIGEIGLGTSSNADAGVGTDSSKLSITGTPLLATLLYGSGIATSLYAGAISLSARAEDQTGQLLKAAKNEAVKQQSTVENFISTAVSHASRKWWSIYIASKIQDRVGNLYAWGQTQSQTTASEIIASCLHRNRDSVFGSIHAFLCEKAAAAVASRK